MVIPFSRPSFLMERPELLKLQRQSPPIPGQHGGPFTNFKEGSLYL